MLKRILNWINKIIWLEDDKKAWFKDFEHFKKTVKPVLNGEQKKQINLGQYLVYLIILQPFFVYDETIQVDKLPDVSNINELLRMYKLRKDDIVNMYTVKFERQK